jgi:tape measure domain-containing protein
MADSYSVQARLSAVDNGFTRTLKNALHSVNSFAKTVGSGMLMGAGMAAFNALSSGARSLVSEISNANVTWETFAANMKILGKGDQEIASVKKSLQDFAQDTIYSASDMATTYSQLAAVGVRNADRLVTGFGGLAAAAEDPTQAMKTLSQQATQMAAKPSVAWADFKLMLEQTPAGIAAVAKEMGMSTSELVQAVQEGEISTKEFFAAIEKAGNSDGFSKLARQAKSVGQAMDGLKETVANKLGPAFKVISDIGIKAIDKIAGAIGAIDAEGLAKKLSGWIKKAKPMWDSFAAAVKNVWKIISGVAKKLKPIFNKIKSTVGNTIKSILDWIAQIDADAVIDKISESLEKAKPYWDAFMQVVNVCKDVVAAVVPVILKWVGKLTQFFLDHSETISKLIPPLAALLAGYLAFKKVQSVIPGLTRFASAIGNLASKGLKGLANKLFNTSKGMETAGKTAQTSSTGLLAGAKAFLFVGIGIAACAAGFWLLADAAIRLTEAGWPAVAVMGGLVIAVGALTIAIMFMMKSITASPKQLTSMGLALLSLGAAVLMVGAGFWLMADASVRLTEAGWPAIAVMAGMVVVLAALAVGAALIGPVLSAGALGFIAFGIAIALCGVAAWLAAVALEIVAGVLPTICQYGLQGALNIAALGVAMLVFAAGAAVAGVACAALAIGMAALAIALAAAAIALAAVAVAVGALAVAALGLGAALMVAGLGLTLIAGVLPTIATYGFQAAGALAAIGGALGIVALSAAGSAAAFAAFAVALGATAVAAPICAGALTLLAGGLWLVADNCMKAGIGTALMASSLPVIAGKCWDAMIALVSIAGGLGKFTDAAAPAGDSARGLGSALAICAVTSASLAKNVAVLAIGVASVRGTLNGMAKIVAVLEKNFAALGNVAENAMNQLVRAMMNAANKANAAGVKIGTGFTNGIQSGLVKAPVMVTTVITAITRLMTAAVKVAAKAGTEIGNGFTQKMIAGLTKSVPMAATMVAAVVATLRAGRSGAYSAGAYVAAGFAQGMASQLAYVRSVATQLAAAAEKAIEAKAKIASPSKVTTKLGEFWGVGFVNGIASMARDAWRVAQELVSIPTVSTPDLAMAYSGEIGADYDYYRNNEYVIEVPLAVDGKEFARATATYTQSELSKQEKRTSRKHGRV